MVYQLVRTDLLASYVARLDQAENKLRAVIGLCQTVSFARRISDKNDEQSAVKAIHETQTSAERLIP